jgi:hypothetical protein
MGDFMTISQWISSQYVTAIGTALIIFANIKCGSPNKINGPTKKKEGWKENTRGKGRK